MVLVPNVFLLISNTRIKFPLAVFYDRRSLEKVQMLAIKIIKGLQHFPVKQVIYNFVYSLSTANVSVEK